MRKLITSLMFALIVSASIAQTKVVSVRTPLANKDTLLTTTTTVTAVKYDTLKYKVPAPVYRAVGPLVLQSGNTYRYLTIDLANANISGLTGNGISRVHITHCKILNSKTDGIYLSNCSNITIDSCFITNVRAGVNIKFSTGIKVNYNQFRNMNGPYPSGNFVQFNNVNAGGNQINYNHCENITGQAQHPQDGISVYQSNGLPGDSIQVIGNWIRGGQVQNDSGGAAAIVLGDVGGSYQVARNNIVVNGGFVGMQVQGGSHIKMDHNLIYGGVTPYSNCGLCYANYSKLPSTDVTISYNSVRYFKTNGDEMDAWVDSRNATTPAGWNTNILKANLSQFILPLFIITAQ